MKSFKQYIAESVHTYDYTIKIAGERDDKWLDMFLYNLNKFEPVEISKPKRTPIQQSPFGFKGITNEPVTIIKGEFRYPLNEPMIRNMARLMGCDENYVRVLNSAFDDSHDSEAEGYEEQMENTPVLDHEEMGEQPGAKEAAAAYGNQYLDSIKDQVADYEIEYEFDGEKTPVKYDPFKPERAEGTKSPMSDMKRPAKPPTGASK